jgi:hypothetical protein
MQNLYRLFNIRFITITLEARGSLIIIIMVKASKINNV